MTEVFDLEEDYDERPPDPRQEEARDYLRDFFERNQERVFYSKQLEVQNEKLYFHWITNRAIRELAFDEGLLKVEKRKLPRAGSVTLYWHKNFRYYKREASRVASIIDEYANPNISISIGHNGEMMVQDAFVRAEFVRRGRETRSYQGKVWTKSDHDLDFIFERDGLAYGIEVKNMLGYMNKEEFDVKVLLCKHLGIRPVFVVRWMPKSWMYELYNKGGFGLLFGYQLYPIALRELAAHIAKELGLPVDAPRALETGTMERFLKFHRKLAGM
jgi:hypothetical protein